MVNLGRDVENIILKYIFLDCKCCRCYKYNSVKGNIDKLDSAIYDWKCSNCKHHNCMIKYTYDWFFN